LEHDADVNTHGRSPLMYAAKEGNRHIVELLLQAGADINTKDLHGQTALTLAKNQEIKVILQDISRATVVDFQRKKNILLTDKSLQSKRRRRIQQKTISGTKKEKTTPWKESK